MKKLLSVLLLAVSLAFSQAATVTFSPVAASNTAMLVITGAVQITSIQIGGVAGNTLFRLFDAPIPTVSYTNSAITNNVYTFTTCSNVYTNYLGTIETNTYPCITNQLVVNVGTTNSWNTVAAITGVTNSTIIVTPAIPFIALRGIAITNANAGSVIITYYPYK